MEVDQDQRKTIHLTEFTTAPEKELEGPRRGPAGFEINPLILQLKKQVQRGGVTWPRLYKEKVTKPAFEPKAFDSKSRIFLLHHFVSGYSAQQLSNKCLVKYFIYTHVTYIF